MGGQPNPDDSKAATLRRSILSLGGVFARWQREAVEAVRKLGGSVFYDCEYDESCARSRRRAPPAPIWRSSFP
jgi:hypothetical protein